MEVEGPNLTLFVAIDYVESNILYIAMVVILDP